MLDDIRDAVDLGFVCVYECAYAAGMSRLCQEVSICNVHRMG